MKIHSLVDVITNSSAVAYIFPKYDADKAVKQFFNDLSILIKEKFGADVDLLSELKVAIVPHKEWVQQQIWTREAEIIRYNQKRENNPNLTDEDFVNRYGILKTEEEFQNYISDPSNAYCLENDYPLTALFVELFGADFSHYFNLYNAEAV